MRVVQVELQNYGYDFYTVLLKNVLAYRVNHKEENNRLPLILNHLKKTKINITFNKTTRICSTRQ